MQLYGNIEGRIDEEWLKKRDAQVVAELAEIEKRKKEDKLKKKVPLTEEEKKQKLEEFMTKRNEFSKRIVEASQMPYSSADEDQSPDRQIKTMK